MDHDDVKVLQKFPCKGRGLTWPTLACAAWNCYQIGSFSISFHPDFLLKYFRTDAAFTPINAYFGTLLLVFAADRCPTSTFVMPRSKSECNFFFQPTAQFTDTTRLYRLLGSDRCVVYILMLFENCHPRLLYLDWRNWICTNIISSFAIKSLYSLEQDSQTQFTLGPLETESRWGWAALGKHW